MKPNFNSLFVKESSFFICFNHRRFIAYSDQEILKLSFINWLMDAPQKSKPMSGCTTFKKKEEKIYR